jgi:hypothetical protein
MSMAVLGWWSLLWDRRELALSSRWRPDESRPRTACLAASCHAPLLTFACFLRLGCRYSRRIRICSRPTITSVKVKSKPIAWGRPPKFFSIKILVAKTLRVTLLCFESQMPDLVFGIVEVRYSGERNG